MQCIYEVQGRTGEHLKYVFLVPQFIQPMHCRSGSGNKENGRKRDGK